MLMKTVQANPYKIPWTIPEINKMHQRSLHRDKRRTKIPSSVMVALNIKEHYTVT